MTPQQMYYLALTMKDILVPGAALYMEAPDQVQEMKQERMIMLSFLDDATRSKSELAQVRYLLDDAEDIIDKFTYHLCKWRSDNTYFGNLTRRLWFPKSVWERRQIATSIRQLKDKLSRAVGPERYQLYASVDRQEADAHDGKFDSEAALFLSEQDLVGIEEPKKELVGFLNDNYSRRTTTSLVAMAGSGKTTLAASLFKSPAAKKFNCRAWITVSRPFNITELLRSLIKEINRSTTATKKIEVTDLQIMSDRELAQKLVDYLEGKTYLVILDDVWTKDVWRMIQVCLPSGQKSRVILTTRDMDIAMLASSEVGSHVYNVKPLDTEKAWDLFCSRAFSSFHSNACPDELRGTANEFLKKCKGLPIAIDSIGRLLATKECSFKAWTKTLDNLQWELNNNELPVNSVLLLSYNDLPYRLKRCFLYFALFPEDHRIWCDKLVRLWMAERFLESDSHGVPPEEVGMRYIRELIGRNLLQAVSWDMYGDHGKCQMHDLYRDIALEISKEDNFCTVYAVGSQVSCQDNKSNHGHRLRRVSIHEAGIEAAGVTNSIGAGIESTGVTNSPGAGIDSSGVTNSPGASIESVGGTNSPGAGIELVGGTNSPGAGIESATGTNSHIPHEASNETGVTNIPGETNVIKLLRGMQHIRSLLSFAKGKPLSPGVDIESAGVTNLPGVGIESVTGTSSPAPPEASSETRVTNIPEAADLIKLLEGMQHIRSLLLFAKGKPFSSLSQLDWGDHHLLRVMDMESGPVIELSKDIEVLYNLEYLNLSNTKMKSLPSTIEKLCSLETLDISETTVDTLPIGVFKLENLRHLLAGSLKFGWLLEYHGLKGVEVPSGADISSLKNLQALRLVEANEQIVKQLRKMIQLVQLGITNVGQDQMIDLCSALKEMVRLRWLVVIASTENETLQMDSLDESSSPPLQRLEYLILCGKLESFPNWLHSLPSLATIRLVWSRLPEEMDPVMHLQGMNSLRNVWLHNAYMGSELRFISGFKSLRALALANLPNLETLTIGEEGVMPDLRIILVRYCPNLKKISEGVKFLSKLKELKLDKVSKELVDQIRGTDSANFKHLSPIFCKYKSTAERTWTTETVFL